MQEKNLQMIGLPQKRDKIGKILTECFTRDLIDMDEYEKRVEQVHLCTTIAELDSLVADVPDNIVRQLENEFELTVSANNKITVSHGIERIKGRRLAASALELEADGSIVRIDFRDLESLPPLMNLQLRATGSQIRIIVPPDILVDEIFDNTASIIRNRRSRKYGNYPVSTKLHIRGNVQGCVVRIKTKKNKRNRYR